MLEAISDILEQIIEFFENLIDAVFGIFDFISTAVSFVSQVVLGAFQFFRNIPKLVDIASYFTIVFHPYVLYGIGWMCSILVTLLLWRVVSKVI